MVLSFSAATFLNLIENIEHASASYRKSPQVDGPIIGGGGALISDRLRQTVWNSSVKLIPSYLPKVKSKDYYSTHPHNLILLE